MPHRIFIVDDHPVVREGYASLIRREPDFMLCGEATTGLEALKRIPKAAPDLVLIDISIPQMDGLELIKRLQAEHSEVRLLAISGHDEVLYAERALRAGARGYIMKDQAVTVIIEAIHTVLAGGLYLSGRLRNQFLYRYLELDESISTSPLERLSDRELEVFQYIGRGVPTREIAEAMLISPKTVETYRLNIKNKLGLESSAEVVRRAVLWVEAISS